MPHCSIKPLVIICNIAVVYDLMYDEDDKAADVLVLLLCKQYEDGQRGEG